MLAQAASFAFLAAISPTALLVLAVYLGTAEPRWTALMYLIGAVLMTVLMAVVLLIVVRSAGLDLPRHRTPRYGVRLGLGVLALAASAFVATRKPATRATPATPATSAAPGKQGGLVSRLVTDPSPVTALLAGVILFAPSITFIAAVQVIATARAGTAVTLVAIIVVVAITAAIVWLPLLAYLISPDRTARLLKALNGWLRRNGRTITMTALAVGGVALVLNGALGLA